MLRKAECPVWAACVAFLFLLIPKQDSNRACCDLREADTSRHLWTLSERKVRELVQQLSLGNPSTETFQWVMWWKLTVFVSLSFSSVGGRDQVQIPTLYILCSCLYHFVSWFPNPHPHENVRKKIGQCGKISERICKYVQNSVCNMKHVCNKGNIREWVFLLSLPVFNNWNKL